MAKAYANGTEPVEDPRGWVAMIPVFMIVLLTLVEWGGVVVIVQNLFDSTTAYHRAAPAAITEEFFR